MFYQGGSIRLATHVSLELDGRERPSSDYYALHKCDVPACVNPEHLYWGTVRDNFNDMIERGRGNMATQRKVFCIRGHRIADNAYTAKSGYRQCAECGKVRYRQKKALMVEANQCSA